MKRCPQCGGLFEAPAARCPIDESLLEDVGDALVGRVLAGRYRVLERIGGGAMGHVYRARHEAVEREVALKVLRAEYAADPVIVRRLRREARAANLLRHEAVAEVYDLVEEGDLHLLVMELLTGETLARRLAAGPMPLAEALEVMIPVTSALARAHAVGVVHRDVKPDNVFLCPGFERVRVKVLDFGIAHVRHDARLTGTHEYLGTPAYSAPEQIRGEAVTPATDLYALGVVLFEVFTGRLPFAAEGNGALMKHLTDAPPRARTLSPELPEALDALVARLLEKDAARRPASASEVLDVLQRAHASLTPRAVAAPPGLDARRGREQLLHAAARAAHPDGATPAWLTEALDEVSAALDALQSLEDELLAVTREVGRVEEHHHAERERLRRALELREAELAALEREEAAFQARVKPVRERLAAAREAFSQAWVTLQDAMSETWIAHPRAFGDIDALARASADLQDAERVHGRVADDARAREAAFADSERAADGLRRELAARDDEARPKLYALRRRADALAARIARQHDVFSVRAELVERHLAGAPASSSLLPARGA